MYTKFVDERRHFIRGIKNRKLTASAVSEFTTFFVLVDVISLMGNKDECKGTIYATNIANISASQEIGLTFAFLLLILQAVSTVLLSCSYKR